MNQYEIRPEGDSALLIVFGTEISRDTNRLVSAAARRVREQGIRGVVDMIPAFVSLLVCYDPRVISCGALRARLETILQAEAETRETAGRVFEIPVCYGGEFGPDLPDIASHAGLTEREVVDIHTSRDYLVYMLGFLPGFCYLGGLDERIHTPRLREPRVRIPAGSVGIGGSQTGIYPMESPGGWQLMGRTPVRLYDPERADPILLRAGDAVRFVPVGEAEYREIEEAVSRNAWTPTLREGGGEA